MSFLLDLWKKNFIKLAVITVAVLLFFRYAVPLLAPFMIAFLFVLIFLPILRKIHQKIKIPEGLLAGVLLGLLAVVLLLAVWFGICWCMDLVGDFRQNEDYLRDCCMTALNTCCDFLGDKMQLDSGQLQRRVLEGTENLMVSVKENFAPKALNASYSYAGTVFDAVFGIVVTVIAIILLTKDYDDIKSKLSESKAFIRVRDLSRKILNLLKIYVKAQAIIVLCVSVVAMAGLWVCGVNRWYLWGFLTGFLDMLPFIGSGIVLLPIVIFMFIEGKIWQGIGSLLVYGICVFLRQILEPKLIGDKINVYPIVVLLSVFFGMQFFNIGGIVLGPVSFFLIREIYEEVRE